MEMDPGVHGLYRRAFLATFETRIAALEQICRCDLQPPQQDGHPPETREWYQKEILDTIGAVRHWFAVGEPALAAAEALDVGLLAARAGARFHWPDVQRWNAHRAMLRKGSKAGVQANRARAAEEATTLRADVRAARLKHPEHSQRSIAGTLLSNYRSRVPSSHPRRPPQAHHPTRPQKVGHDLRSCLAGLSIVGVQKGFHGHPSKHAGPDAGVVRYVQQDD